jgi:hypothetical protein
MSTNGFELNIGHAANTISKRARKPAKKNHSPPLPLGFQVRNSTGVARGAERCGWMQETSCEVLSSRKDRQTLVVVALGVLGITTYGSTLPLVLLTLELYKSVGSRDSGLGSGSGVRSQDSWRGVLLFLFSQPNMDLTRFRQ